MLISIYASFIILLLRSVSIDSLATTTFIHEYASSYIIIKCNIAS